MDVYSVTLFVYMNPIVRQPPAWSAPSAHHPPASSAPIVRQSAGTRLAAAAHPPLAAVRLRRRSDPPAQHVARTRCI